MVSFMRLFGEALSRTRKEQGFSSAYAFYHGVGGRSRIGVTFPNYARAERGASLPKGPVFRNILLALQLPENSPELRGLLLAYIACLLDTDAFGTSLTASADAEQSPGSWLLAEALARQSVEERKVQPTMAQYRLLARSPDAYAVHVMLYNTTGGLRRSFLARRTGLSSAKLAGVLSSLRRAGLVRLAGAKARSVWEGRFVTPPEPVGEMKEVFAALSAHRTRWMAEGKARLVDAPYLNLRAPWARLHRFRRHLGDSVRMAALFGKNADTPDSAFFLVEGRVFELFPDSAPRA